MLVKLFFGQVHVPVFVKKIPFCKYLQYFLNNLDHVIKSNKNNSITLSHVT